MIFFKGFLIGLFLCAPFGPVGILCLRRILLDGKTAGLFSVLGASCVDLLYCTIAGFGIVYVSDLILREKESLRIMGSVILLCVGLFLIHNRNTERAPDRRIRNHLEAFSSTFLLTLAHPVPILIFTAAFASFGIQGWQEDPIPTCLLVSGTFAGSALWAPILVGVAGRFHFQALNSCHMMTINRISGVLFTACGLCLGVWAFL